MQNLVAFGLLGLFLFPVSYSLELEPVLQWSYTFKTLDIPYVAANGQGNTLTFSSLWNGAFHLTSFAVDDGSLLYSIPVPSTIGGAQFQMLIISDTGVTYAAEQRIDSNYNLTCFDTNGNTLPYTIFIGIPITAQYAISHVSNMIVLAWIGSQCVAVTDPQLTDIWGEFCWQSRWSGDTIVETSHTGLVYVIHTTPLTGGNGVGTFVTALQPTTNLSVIWETNSLGSVPFQRVNASVVVTAENDVPMLYLAEITYSNLNKINGATGAIEWTQNVMEDNLFILSVIAVQSANSNATNACLLYTSFGPDSAWALRCVSGVNGQTVLYFDSQQVKENFGAISVIFATSGLLMIDAYSILYGVNITSGQIVLQQSIPSIFSVMPLSPSANSNQGWGSAASTRFAYVTNVDRTTYMATLSVYSIGPTSISSETSELPSDSPPTQIVAIEN